MSAKISAGEKEQELFHPNYANNASVKVSGSNSAMSSGFRRCGFGEKKTLKLLHCRGDFDILENWTACSV